MSAETDIAAIDDGGENTALEVRTALTSVLGRADLGSWQDPAVPDGTVGDIEWSGTDLSAFTAVTPTGTQSQLEGTGLMSAKFSGQSPNDLCAILKPHTFSIGDSFAVPVRTLVSPGGTSSVAIMAGLAFTDGLLTSSNVAAVHLQTNSPSSAPFVVVGRHGTLTNAATAPQVSNSLLTVSFPWLWLRLDYSALNTFILWVSPDGLQWSTLNIGTFTKAMTPTHVGFVYMADDAAGDAIASFGPLRKIA